MEGFNKKQFIKLSETTENLVDNLTSTEQREIQQMQAVGADVQAELMEVHQDIHERIAHYEKEARELLRRGMDMAHIDHVARGTMHAGIRTGCWGSSIKIIDRSTTRNRRAHCKK